MDDSFFDRFLRRENRQKPHVVLMRSGLVTALVLTTMLLVLGLIWRQRGRGNLHRLTAPHVLESAPTVRPGGQEPITLSRLSLLNGAVPEFLSAELLPGLGMQILQLNANLPDKGEVRLFAAPELNDIDAKNDAVPGSAFFLSTDQQGKHALSGNSFDLPARPADTVDNTTMPDGGAAAARFFPTVTDSAGKTTENGIEVSIKALLSGHTLDLTMTARNVTEQAHTVELSWAPRFRAPSGDLRDFHLLVPSSERVLGSSTTSVHGSSEDFSNPSGSELGHGPIHVTYVNLKHSFLGNGPVVELRDMRNRFALRLTALSPSIRSLHVETPTDEKSVQVIYSTADQAGGRVGSQSGSMLRPGQQMDWKVRLEIVALAQEHALPQVGGFGTTGE